MDRADRWSRATRKSVGFVRVAANGARIMAIVIATGVAGAPQSSQAVGPIASDDVAHVGPLSVSIRGRDRVRGDRPDGASIHVAWAHGIDDPGRADRNELAQFERATFPPDQPPPKTIVDRPPDSWMAKLAKPGLSVRWNAKTVEYLRYFKDDGRGQSMMRAWMRRMGRYGRRIRGILRKVGVPEDLVMVALAESGFNPRVRSRVGAAGLWQFMEGTGRVYGLERSYWVDERFDIEKSTYAAALYLKDLKVRFGSWELALAAYNAGYGLVMQSVARHNTNNFWTLAAIENGLPYATTNYVPKIVAAALVGRNRAVFKLGGKHLKSDRPVDWVEVEVRQSTKLEQIAKLTDSDPALIDELNARYIRRRTPPRGGPYRVRIPRDRLARFEQRRGRLAQDWARETTYEVRHGETLARIARATKTTEKKLRRLNGIRDSAELVGGLTIVVPADPAASEQKAPEPRPLAAVPPLRPGPGQRLVFFATTRASTPRSVAQAFGVRWEDIVAWNDLDAQARTQARQLLQILVPRDFVAKDIVVLEREDVEYVIRGTRAHVEAGLERRGLVRRGYTAKKGDTLKRIGKRFKLSIGSLARINGFARTHDPAPGELLVVYVQKGKTRGTVTAPEPTELYTPPQASTRPPSGPTTSRVPAARRDPKPPRKPSKAGTSRVPGR